MMENNNSNLQSDILDSFKVELQDTLTRNNNDLSLKISTDLDQQFLQFQSYLMTLVKKLVTEMSLLRTSSYSPPNINTPTIYPPTVSSLIHTIPSS